MLRSFGTFIAMSERAVEKDELDELEESLNALEQTLSQYSATELEAYVKLEERRKAEVCSYSLS